MCICVLMLPCHSSARRRNVYIHLSARAPAHGCFCLHGTGAEQQAHLNTRCPLPVANPRGHARSGMRGAAGTWASHGEGTGPCCRRGLVRGCRAHRGLCPARPWQAASQPGEDAEWANGGPRGKITPRATAFPSVHVLCMKDVL